MQRKAVRRRVLPGIAMLTALAAGAAGLTGCTSGSGDGSTSDSKAGGSSAAPAQPGKYRSLPAPCKAGADSKKLKGMLPVGDSLTPEQRDQMYAGVADASYDGDRHVGCRWTGQSPEETRLLSVGFERVVSYDRTTSSDDDKAKQVYVRRLTDAKLPFPGPTASPTPTAPTPAAPTPAAPSPSVPAAPGAPVSPSASPSAPVELGSRVLEDLGNDAFLEDKLSPAGASAAQSRTVRIVFRTSNVIVTIEYSVQPALPGTVPPSTETQDKARQLAQALAERLSE
ncbi:DUF3558 domain-containing protein [Streptomyces virginiae]|uniref:DUF3558 domain-containing protein n=1 Tax=Streptomyces virginiae TaxID=1961 RepID=UPI002258F850|nr:DUF3558 domain-containing protein [Streptomyces virginiae]MCX5177726.1 DUF3558 domain-containing protein [Streptomyces virginiae]